MQNSRCPSNLSYLTHLSNNNDLEKNLSTFASEMVSSAMMLGSQYHPVWACQALYAGTGLASPKTLVLVDKLGRGTSPTEGVGISHAIAEGLIALKVRLYSHHR
jgi:DNA mismatch repair protein MSH4